MRKKRAHRLGNMETTLNLMRTISMEMFTKEATFNNEERIGGEEP